MRVFRVRTAVEHSVSLAGARAALLLVHRGEGRAASAVVFDNYRKGEPSSTPQEPLVNGQIARAVD